MSRHALLLIALLLALLAWSTPAAAQVRRCVDAQGMSVFTDRPCSEMNAAPKQAPPDAGGNLASGFQGGFAQVGCARRPEDLLDRVRAALEARDVNRLASHYHWTGTGSGSGRRLMDELEAIAAQPLLSAELVYPDPPATPEIAETPFTDSTPAPSLHAAGANPTLPRQIRVLQMRTDQAEQTRSTDFALRRNAGCWWIEL